MRDRLSFSRFLGLAIEAAFRRHDALAVPRELAKAGLIDSC